MQVMTRKRITLRTLYVRVVLNGVICPQILYDIVLYALYFLLVKFFLIFIVTLLRRELSGKV